MHYKEIADIIVDKKLRTKIGATPAATVSAQLALAINSDGDSCPFQKVGRGLYIWKKHAENITSPKPSGTDDEEIEEQQYKIISSFGMYWRRDQIDWARTPKILGKQQIEAKAVDFTNQIGIYLLYDGREVVYVGRTTERPLGRRLFEHTLDRLSSRWDRFSWFGILPVSDTGDLGNPEGSFQVSKLLPALEAILIEALEPRQNRKRGDDLAAVEYIQAIDPKIQEKLVRETMESFFNKPKN